MFNGHQTTMTLPNPQVTPKAERRRFSAEYKLRILSEADACTERGQIGALLRREGLKPIHGSTFDALKGPLECQWERPRHGFPRCYMVWFILGNLIYRINPSAEQLAKQTKPGANANRDL